MDSHILIISLLVFQTIVHCNGKCFDLDPLACVQMSQQGMPICTDTGLSSICQSFCGLCSPTCYDCHATHTNYTMCGNVNTCQIGEKCILLSSATDYVMQCATQQMCDILTRRDVGKRTIQTASCCSSDQCNYPTPSAATPVPTTTTLPTTHVPTTTVPTPKPTTTNSPVTHAPTTQSPQLTSTSSSNSPYTLGCYRDIEILVQDSQDRAAAPLIKQYLKDLVNSMEIGQHANKIGLALYSHHVDVEFGLHNHKDTSQLLVAIDNINFEFDDNEIDKDDVMEFLREHVGQNRDGNRLNYSNVVIIIVDHTRNGWNNPVGRRFLLEPINHVNQIVPVAKDVIIINVGVDNSASPFSNVATDANHVIHTDDINGLQGTLPKLLSLICQ